jgi:superfamily II DNA or RNA helicase
MLQLRDYQEKVKRDLYTLVREGFSKVLVVASTGSGKCLGKGTPVMLYDGTIKPVEEIKVGDQLMGDDSTPRTVLSLARGQEELFKVTPVKGDSWVCNKSHILSLVCNAKKGALQHGQIYDIPVGDYLELGRTHKHVLKQYRVGVTEFGNNSGDLPVDPWLLGLFIGDGHKTGNSFHLNDTTKIDVAVKASSVLVDSGFSPSSSREGSAHGVRLGIRMNTATERFIYFVRRAWDGEILNAHNIYIPHKYKTSSIENRLALLAGLIDSDGSFDGMCFSFSTVSESLADDVCFVARSLGLAAYKAFRATKCDGKSFPSFRVSISGDLSGLPCARWQTSERKQIKSVLRTGFSIESLGVGDYYGFTIDGNHRFLLGDFTVTHNTETAVSIVEDALSKGRRVAFVVHRDNLVRQTLARFQKYGLNPSAVKAGFKPDYDNPCQVVSLQTVVRRKNALHTLEDIAIYDEAHITAWSTLGKDLITNNAHRLTIGLTATPWRLSKREEMGDLFSEVVCAPLPAQLIEKGFLVPPRYFGLDGIDTSEVRTTAGDFNLGDLGVLTNDPEVVQTAVREWLRLAENRKTIVFCVNVAHSQAIAREFNRQGIPAAHVDGTMDSVKECQPLYDKLAKGKIKVISSCEKLSEGFDVPDIGCAMLCRPTKSRAKYVQQIGRALRIFPGKKDAIILDQAGNVPRHGFVEDLTKADFRLYLSTDAPKGEPPVKECECCHALVRISARECPECGNPFPIKEREKAVGQLTELRQPILVESELPYRHQQYRQWRWEAYKKGIAPGYAMAKYREIYDDWPPNNLSLGAVFKGKNDDKTQKHFLNYLERIAIKKSWDKKKITQEFTREFGFPPAI